MLPALQVRAPVVAGTPPINPSSGAGVGPINSFLGQTGELPLARTTLADVLRSPPPFPMPRPPSYQRPLHCQPDVVNAMKTAWTQSGNGTSGVEAGFRLDGTPKNYSIVRNAFSNQTMHQTMNVIRGSTFASFHVHPNRTTRNPSTPENNYLNNGIGDTGIAGEYNIRFYVMHRAGLTMYDPATRQTTVLRENLDWTKPCF